MSGASGRPPLYAIRRIASHLHDLQAGDDLEVTDIAGDDSEADRTEPGDRGPHQGEKTRHAAMLAHPSPLAGEGQGDQSFSLGLRGRYHKAVKARVVWAVVAHHVLSIPVALLP